MPGLPRRLGKARGAAGVLPGCHATERWDKGMAKELKEKDQRGRRKMCSQHFKIRHSMQ